MTVYLGPPYDKLLPGGVVPMECLDCGFKTEVERPAGVISWHPRCRCGAHLVREGTTRADLEALKRAVREALKGAEP